MNHTWKKETIKDEGGKTFLVRHTCVFDDGETLQFTERNVFDFGIVINPDYVVEPGHGKGGLVEYDKSTDAWYFMDFSPAIYQVGDETGDSDFVDKKFHVFKLPDGYRLTKTIEERESYFAFLTEKTGEKYTETVYRVIDSNGDMVTHCSMPAWGNTEEQAMSTAFWGLCVKVVDRGGWSRVREMTAHEVEAYKYISNHGYYSEASIRMDASTGEDRVAKEEAALENACEAGLIPGAL